MAKGKGRNVFLDKVIAGVAMLAILWFSFSNLGLFMVIIIGIVGYFLLQFMYAGGRKQWRGPKTADIHTDWYDAGGVRRKQKHERRRG